MKTNIEDISNIADIQYGDEVLDTTVNFASKLIENIAKQNKS